MKKVTFILCLLMALTVTSYAQTDNNNRIVKRVEAKTYDKSRGADPNIKSDIPTTDVAEAGNRNQACAIYFDSYCGYYIKVYVDGRYRGTMSPYGSLRVVVGDGYTTIYCVSTGGTRYWSDSGNCSGTYDFELYCD